MQGCFNSRTVALMILACLLLLAFGPYPACSSSTHTLKNMSDMEYTSSECRGIIERWTRSGPIHKDLRTERLVTATHKAEKFRRAYTREYTRIQWSESLRVYRGLRYSSGTFKIT